ncbi:VOC family protein [soil metagenome]
MKLTRILETSLHATDLEAAESFYTKLLGCEPQQKMVGRFVFYKLEAAMFLLFNPAATSGDNHGIPPHGTRGAGHLCFRIGENEVEAWKARLGELGIPLEAEHIWSNGTVSLYFRDPEGNSLELAPWKIWEREV